MDRYAKRNERNRKQAAINAAKAADPKRISERFWSRVDKNGPVQAHVPHLGPCWVWTGSPGSHGYGRMNVSGRMTQANRIAWFVQHGRWPAELVLHKCDGGKIGCVRPDHLFEGTAADNTHDMCAKGRHGRTKRSAAQAGAREESSHP